MRVAACIPTRGDHALSKIIESIPEGIEVVVWDNSVREDLAVYGRYAAIQLTDADVIVTQDDDCVLDPEGWGNLLRAYEPGKLTANMPARFRHSFYADHCLVGFGAIFDRDLPTRAFIRFREHVTLGDSTLFHRACDVVFTTLTPRVLVDVPHRDLSWASDPDRMWKQPTHQGERAEVLGLAKACR